MAHQFWRLSEAGPDNLGPACTEDGLLLGRTPLIERRDGRFVVRNRDEIERLFKRAYGVEPTMGRLMSGLATVASALNANDVCLARIAAVHLKIPDLPNRTARDAIEAEDSLIKFAYAKGGSADWDPALHPRTGTPPNPGWFAPTSGGDDGSFWSNVSSTVRDWLQQPVPEYDLDTGRVMGERPRWQAIAPYVGISAATAAILGGPVGLGAGAIESGSGAAGNAGAIISSIAQGQADLGVGSLSRYMSANQLRAYLANPAAGSRFLGTAVHNATAKALEMRYPFRFIYNLIGPDFLDTTTGDLIELTTPRQVGAHLARPGYGRVTIATYTLP